MRKAIIILSFVLGAAASLRAQAPAGYVEVDSLVYRQVDALDASLEGKSIFSVISSEKKGLTVSQDASITSGMAAHVKNNKSKSLQGYRIRIFFDNKQNSRGESEAALARFKAMYPGVPAYRSFTNPFFKVTVGDFRTKSEATALLVSLKSMFPNAFVLKENINYPAVDRQNSYVVDTVTVFRPVSASL